MIDGGGYGTLVSVMQKFENKSDLRGYELYLRMALVFWVLAIGSVLPVKSTSAQQALSIAATVNDEMISILDIQARLALSIQLSNLPSTPETRTRLMGPTLRALIDEKLKLQEAKRFNIAVTKAEIARAERQFETGAGLSKGGLRRLLKNLGIDASSIIERFESEVSWSRFITRRYIRTISVGDQEVDDFLAELEQNKGKPEYRVSEIFLPAADSQQREQARQLGARLVQQIKAGADFGAIARNFSQSSTAATGGDTGWHAAGQLSAEIDSIVARLGVGQLAGPIETVEGYYVIRLVEKRTIDPFREAAPKPETVTLHQAHFGLPENPAESLVQQTLAKAEQVASRATDCASFDELAKQMGSPLSGKLGTFPIGQLSQQLRDAVAPLAVGQASRPVRTEGGYIVVIVCDRKKPAVKKADPESRREKVRDQLINERLNLISEQYIRNLRRTAIIDLRLK